MPHERLATAQVLRALAALLVVVSHAQHEAGEISASLGLNFDEKTIPGDAGVDIFFVLSGFVMMYVARRANTGPAAAGLFILRRLIRLTPLYWACTTMMIAIAVFLPHLIDHSGIDPWHVITSYFYIPYQRGDDMLVRPMFALGWTLIFEMMFYVLFALSLLLPRTAGRTALVGAIGLLVATGLMGVWTSTAMTFWSHPMILEFAAGALIGWLYVSGVRLSSAAILPGLGAGIVLLAMSPHLKHDMDPLRVVYFGMPATIIVGACLLGLSEKSEALMPRALVWLGDSSYSLYLIHPFALGLVRLAWSRANLDAIAGPWAFVAVATLACIAAGHLVYRFGEMPIMRISRRWLSRTDAGAARIEPAAARPPMAAHPAGG